MQADQKISYQEQKAQKISFQGKRVQHKQKPLDELSSLVIQIMKKTKKSSILFKPIKKLKTSIQSISTITNGQDKTSIYESTKRIVIFHFGLGNQVDKQLIVNGTNLNNQQNQINQFVILPGKAFTIVDFVSRKQAQRYVSDNKFVNLFQEINNNQQQMQIINNQKQQKQQPLFYFKQMQWKNLSRLMIFFYLKRNQNKSGSEQSSLIKITNCPQTYNNDIPGLHLIQQFINSQQQSELHKWLDANPWQKLSNRRVQHYGYEFKYGRNQIDKDQQYQHKMPQVFQFLLKRITKTVRQLSGQQIYYDQLTVNDYFAGHGIPSHFDTHSPFQQYFVALSMLSAIVMDWRKYDSTQKTTYLKQRSLVVFSGQARYAWQHSIACRKLDNINNQVKHRSRRISLTFRKIKHSACLCKYYFYCDSQGYNQQTMKKNNPLLNKYLCEQNKSQLKSLTPNSVYKEYVIKAYNSFGYDFHNKIIVQVKQYLQQLIIANIGQVVFVLDIGCGNGEYGKLLQHNEKFFYIPLEICTIMIPLLDQLHMDARKLSFKQSMFDVVLLVAVLHHFTTQNDRLQCLIQAKKVLKANTGILLLTVFNYQGKKHEYPQQDILLDYCLPHHKTLSQQKDINQKQNLNLPVFAKQIQKQKGKQTNKGQIFSRYYHLFRLEEIIYLVQKSGLAIDQIKISKDNIVLKLIRKQ